jgi:hypothetical protein
MPGDQELEHRSPREFEPEPKRPLVVPDNRKVTPTDILVFKGGNAFTHDAPKEKTPVIVKPPVLKSPPDPFKFTPDNPSGFIRNFLIEVRKSGGKFWVGVAVPADTADFTRAHVFFHPTVVQQGVIVADDKDYPNFVGGWPGEFDNIQRYVNIIGGQFASAGGTVPVFVPFMTMAAVQKPTGSSNIFADRPLRTLNAVMGLIQDEVTGKNGSKPELKAIAASSFSSGVTAMKHFIGTMGGTKVIKEVNDFDGPFIVGAGTKAPVRAAGAVARTFSQEAAPPGAGALEWITLKQRHFELVRTFSGREPKKRLHQQIGNHMFHPAMLSSVVF